MKNIYFQNFLTSLIIIFLLLFGNSCLAVKLEIPRQLIAFDAPAGINIFNEAQDKADYWKLSQYFVTQQNQTFCSIASLVMVLNASSVPKPIEKTYAPYGFFTQHNIFNSALLNIASIKEIDQNGLTLEQLKNIAATFPIKVKAVHAINNSGIILFRKYAKKTLATGNSFIIVNFFRPGINEIGGGHFSPLAAYDQHTDRFLLMDVARYKYPPVWVKTQALWNAMATRDSTSKMNRGYVIISPKLVHLK